MVVGHPALLFRRTEAHPENIGSRGLYLGSEICFFGLRERAKGRRVGAGHGNVELFVKLARQVLRDTGSAAAENVRATALAKRGACRREPPAQPDSGFRESADPAAIRRRRACR